MKKILLILLFGLFALGAVANDVIVYKDGKVVVGKVLEINQESVRFKRADNPDGPVYTEPVSNLLSIKYEDGLVRKFVEEAAAAAQSESQQMASVADRAEKVETEEEEAYDSPRLFCPEANIMIGANTKVNVDDAREVSFVANFHVLPNLMVGPGVAARNCEVTDFENDGSIVLFLQGRYNFLQRRVSPFVVGNVGYPLDDSSIVCTEIDGEEGKVAHYGLSCGAGIGAALNLRRVSIMLNLSYRFQNFTSYLKNQHYVGVSVGFCWTDNSFLFIK